MEAARDAFGSVLFRLGGRSGLPPAPKKTKEENDKEEERQKWAPPSQSFDLWLPATTRPAPPTIDHINVALWVEKLPPKTGLDGTFTVGVEQSCVLTIWQARPFLGSGGQVNGNRSLAAGAVRARR